MNSLTKSKFVLQGWLLFCCISCINASKRKYIDLSYSFNNQTIYFPGQRVEFELHKDKYGYQQETGKWYASYSFCMAEHGGTHVDAPIHFIPGGLSLSEIPLAHFVDVPAAVVDISDLVFSSESPDQYSQQVQDLIRHESRHGRIPFRGVVLVNTGWARYWPDKEKYLGFVNDTSEPSGKPLLSFPGCSLAAAQWLVNERGIVGFGIDTASVDVGLNGGNYPVHEFFGEQQVYNIENVANLHLVIQAVTKSLLDGSLCNLQLFVLPIKITGATGGPARVLAYCKH